MTLGAPQVGGDRVVDVRAPRPVRQQETVLRGRVWDVHRDTVDLGPAGEVVREYVVHPGAVAVVALRSDRGPEEVLLVQQYRHPVRMLEWELPAGLLDAAGEAPRRTAERELAEEADLTAGTWHRLGGYHSSPGGLDERIELYLARDLRDVPEPDRFARAGEEQGMPARWVRLDDAVDAVVQGRIGNAAAVVGLLLTDAARRRRWTGLDRA